MVIVFIPLILNIGNYQLFIRNYIVPQLGKMYMSTLNQGYIRKLYNTVAEKYESVAKNVRTIMKTSLEYAFNKNVLATNLAKGINLPKKIKKTEYRVLKIDEKKTLTLPQVLQLIEASKETPIHMQILFAVLMGLRRSEINGLKYSDVDYIHRTLRVERQLGKKPNSKAEDCLDVLEPFIEEVIPKERKDQYYDYSEVIEIDLILEEYFNAA